MARIAVQGRLFAFRILRKNIVVTGAAVVSLSLAIGACLAAFSLVDALILRPLPLRDPHRLIYLTFPTYSAGSHRWRHSLRNQ
jgi:hypothetical protein